ncbi:MAG: flagellar basal body P-ring formation protein FlgA [Bradyrhizobium sp.]|uniref:flagellar basal body P-ring formation chaperone FlgA n=1 Tax=Bradyrhizobium sp. TaxID=376 RepID=UPI0025C67036|nr:flagellar basal body P-ring formation chaperone FlgA [Bradyrhizobium sp.]MBI5262067.1 flagellar basal body P-ring formation protein FlgA [Bradyrhizobium sp.]
MTARTLLLAVALLALPASAPAQGGDDIAAPVLRAQVTVTSDVVRVGDVVDNAGPAAQIAIYRSPDLGTTGTLPVKQVLDVLRGRNVIGVDARNIRVVEVTRLARTLATKDIELAVAAALDHRFGLGDSANIGVTVDRAGSDLRLDASSTGALQASALRYDPRNGRFDITFEIAGADSANATRLRFTGTAIETVEVAVLTRDVDRTDTLKSSDLAMERRPKAEITGEAAIREKAIGMQLRRAMRAGSPVKAADLARPDLVQRDQSVTVIYRIPGLHLTARGKALESGTEGDVVSVMNLQSKRTLTGVVTGRGQVTVQPPTSTLPAAEHTSSIEPDPRPAPVALASSQIPRQVPEQVQRQVASQVSPAPAKAE